MHRRDHAEGIKTWVIHHEGHFSRAVLSLLVRSYSLAGCVGLHLPLTL
jgi:hypothetical protein